MSTSYTIKKGPGRKDLILGLTEDKMIWFKVFDEKNQTHLFQIHVLELGLPIQDPDRLAWTLNGLIVEKDGRELEKLQKCRANFDSRRREGHFEEYELIRPHSYEYYSSLSDHQLQDEILKERKWIPVHLRELDEYAANLSNRERLILQVLHARELSEAAAMVKLDHEFNVKFKKQRC
jgi:hypothetical protein